MILDAKKLHHAYCIVGEAEKINKDLERFLNKELGFKVSGNPDFWTSRFDTMTIDDVRYIAELHGKKPLQEDKKIFVVFANFITEQAQNAMLKMFEEPK